MLGEMLQLPINFPEMHQEFMRGKHALQLCDNSGFSRVETDTATEMALNKNTKEAMLMPSNNAA